MRFAPCLGLVLVACAATPEPEPRAAEPEAFGLPPIRSELVFPPGASDVTLAWLVGELARLSGQELAIEPGVRTTLEATREPLEQATNVPAREVYPFVEGLLVTHGVYLAPVKSGERPVLGVYRPVDGRDHSQGTAVAVTLAELPDLARHPALLCQLTLTFANVDSRELQTQLRWMLVPSEGFQQAIPAGERGLVLQGRGNRVLGLARSLLEIDRVGARSTEPQAAAR